MATNKALNIAVPDAANQWANDFDSIRDNWIVLAGIGAGALPVLPGWGTSVNGSDKAKPDDIVLTKNGTTLKLKIAYTWSDNFVVTITISYDNGSGYDVLEDGVITLSYDANGNFISATSADS